MPIWFLPSLDYGVLSNNMSFLKTLSLIALASTTSLGLVACGGDETGGGGGGGGEIDTNGTHTKFVVNDLIVPASASEATAVALDLNDDGLPDNALGGLLGALATTAGLDLQSGVNDQLAAATFTLLLSMKATDLVNANGAGAYLFFGENPTPAACTDPADPLTCGKHLAGGASFDVAANSPSDAVIVGQIAGGNFTGGPGNVSIELPLGEGTPLRMDLIAAHLDVEVGSDNLMSGKLGGAITKEDVENKLMPAVQSLVAGIIDEDCTGAGDNCGCPDASTGLTVLNFFDENDDCEIPLQELMDNSLVGATILNPDLDLLDEAGNFNPGVDGKEDSLSISIGITGVPAEFPLPAGI